MMDIVVGTYKWMLMMTIVIAGGALLGKPPYHAVHFLHAPAVLNCRHSGNHTRAEIAEFAAVYVKICTGSIIIYASLGKVLKSTPTQCQVQT